MKENSTFDFGRTAAKYDTWYTTPAGRRHDMAQKKLVGQLLPPAVRGAKLLDAGCGTGHWSEFFAVLGFEVTGIDIAPAMIEIARQRQLAACQFKVGDILALPFPDGAFDVVCAITVLEFVADVPRACTEMFRCLKPGGCLILGTLNRLAELNRKRARATNGPFAVARFFTLSELQEILAPFGVVTIGISAENCGYHQRHRSADKADGLDAGSNGALIVARVDKR